MVRSPRSGPLAPVGGLKRTYYVHVPPQYDPEKPAPVVLALHGATLNGPMMAWRSEHHGDDCPGSTVFVWMTGIGEFHRGITGKGYKYLRPGVEKAFYGAKYVEVIDPFGISIRLNGDLKTAQAT